MSIDYIIGDLELKDGLKRLIVFISLDKRHRFMKRLYILNNKS